MRGSPLPNGERSDCAWRCAASSSAIRVRGGALGKIVTLTRFAKSPHLEHVLHFPRTSQTSSLDRRSNAEQVSFAVAKPCAPFTDALAGIVSANLRNTIDRPQAGQIIFLEHDSPRA